MKVNLNMELEAESVSAAVTQVLYALEYEGGEVDVLEISASPSLEIGTPESDVQLDGDVVRTSRALPATLS